MTFGEKLSKLRKEYNYTQEQLADILGVTRQSISKWESDIAYPETEKLIKLGRLFECSMDYLLSEDVTEKQGAQVGQAPPKESLWEAFKKQLHERKSDTMVLGMPLYAQQLLSVIALVICIVLVIYMRTVIAKLKANKSE